MEIHWPSGCIAGSYGSLDALHRADLRYQLHSEARPRSNSDAVDLGSRPIDLRGGCPPILPSQARRLVATVEELVDGRALFVGSNDQVAAIADADFAFWDPSAAASPPDLSAFHTVVLSIPGPSGWLDALIASLQCPPAQWMLRVRAPYDAWCRKLVNDAVVRHYYRDFEHYVLPGPVVLDGGGDLWVIEATDRMSFDGNVDVLPRHSWRDLDGLDPDRCTLESLQTFFELVEERYDESVEFNDVRRHAAGISGALYFSSGAGLTSHIRLNERHALFSFHPYNPALEITALSSVFECFGTEQLRTRPVRTMWSPTEMVF